MLVKLGLKPSEKNWFKKELLHFFTFLCDFFLISSFLILLLFSMFLSFFSLLLFSFFMFSYISFFYEVIIFESFIENIFLFKDNLPTFLSLIINNFSYKIALSFSSIFFFLLLKVFLSFN